MTMTMEIMIVTMMIMMIFFVMALLRDGTTTTGGIIFNIGNSSSKNYYDIRNNNNSNNRQQQQQKERKVQKKNENNINNENNAIGRFLWFSDFHLDPFFGSMLAFDNGPARFGSNCRENISSAASSSNSNDKDYYRHGKFGCDAPMTLIDSCLEAATSLPSVETLDFVLVTGDFSRHGNEELDDPTQALYDLLATMAQKLNSTFSSSSSNKNNLQHDISIIPSLGNNDVTPDYYLYIDDDDDDHDNNDTTKISDRDDDHNRILDIVTDAFSDSRFSLFKSSEEIRTFRKGGYFARNITTTKSNHNNHHNTTMITVISLNTIIYSLHHQPDQLYNQDPFGQFQWLEEQLQMASAGSHKVYLTGHIAPAIGSYRHSQLWHEQYLQTYYDILQKYSDTIAAHLFGHLHSEEFRLITRTTTTTNNNKQIITNNEEDKEEYDSNDYDNDTTNTTTTTTSTFAILMAASVTPIYGSNPSFRVVTYNTTAVATNTNNDDKITKNTFGSILDYETYYYNLAAANNNKDQSNTMDWQRYPTSFRESYRIPDLSVSSLTNIVDAFFDDTNTTDITANKINDINNNNKRMIRSAFLNRQMINATTLGEETCDWMCRAEWYCTFSVTTSDEFEDCKQRQQQQFHNNNNINNNNSGTTMMEMIVGVLVAVCIVLLVLYLYLQCYRIYKKRSQYNKALDLTEEDHNTIMNNNNNNNNSTGETIIN